MADMSVQKLKPADPSRTLKVIGAGYSRTATVSFTMALQILLKGPVCHSGTASVAREEAFIKDLIKIMNLNPTEPSAAEITKKVLAKQLAGYVGVTDCPCILFSGELAEIYPESIVICTTRDPAKWWVSFQETSKTVMKPWLVVAFQSMPSLRYFGKWIEGLRHRHAVVYNNGEWYESGPDHLEKHYAYLKSVIPKDRLFFFNVKDGWGPLCKILDLPIPDEPFPFANDKEAVKAFIAELAKQALIRWAALFAGVGGLAASAFWLWRK
ncbi:hypothetical protein B0J14DRAFT_572535 [Halenospora varia]|nr:hypothetical protein B0J14DRAFT_572535 [Halenospora varia]